MNETVRCRNGHLLTPENTYRSGGTWFCRLCRLASNGFGQEQRSAGLLPSIERRAQR